MAAAGPRLNPTLAVVVGDNVVTIGTTMRSAVSFQGAAADHVSFATGETSCEQGFDQLNLAGFEAKPPLTVSAEVAEAISRDRRVAFWSLLAPNPIEVLQALHGKRVCVYGLGGVGAAVDQFLAMQGVGELILVDDDLVEEVNISKSTAYAKKDIGSKKCYSLAHALSHICHAIPLDGRLTQEVVSSCDFIAWCGDDDERNVFSYLAENPDRKYGLISGGINEHEVIVGPTLNPEDTYKRSNGPYGQANVSIRPGVNPGTIISVSICASLIANEICLSLSGAIAPPLRNHILTIDLITMATTKRYVGGINDVR